MRRIICLALCACLIWGALPVLGEDSFENLAPKAELTPLTLRATNDHLFLIDGNKSVSKQGEAWTVRKNTWVKFDFGAQQSINRIDVYEFNGNKVQRLRGYKVQASQDGVSWETIQMQGTDNVLCETVIKPGHYYTKIEFEKVTARFFRFTVVAAIDPSGDENKGIGYVEEIEMFDTKPQEQGKVIEGAAPAQTQDEPSRYAMVDYSKIMKEEADWIRAQQIDNPGEDTDGAIVMNKANLTRDTDTGKDEWNIEPYFATLACIGLLDVPEEQNIAAVKKWIDWYIGHINRTPDKYGLTGTIYTRRVNAVDPNDYRSTDEYSASDSRGSTFLMMIRKFYEVTGDLDFITKRKADIELIFDSSIATLREDGLAEAKNQDGHRTKYLQDNCQVNASLSDMVELQRDIWKDPAKTAYYQEKLELSTKGLESMWLKDRNEYIYYIVPTKTRLVDWSVFYGDSVSEVFPILYEILPTDSERAIHLYSKFSAEQPNRVYRVGKTEFPWMATSVISAMMGDKARTNEQLYNMSKKYMETGRNWTWYIFEAGNAIRAAKVMRDQMNLARNRQADVSSNQENAAFLNDGRLETAWKADTGAEQWLTVDLGEEKNVNRTILKADTAQYTVFYSSDNQQYQPVSGSFTGDIFAFPAVNARYLKFVVPGGTTVTEAEAYCDAENLALGGQAAASANSDSAQLALDNTTTTKWQGDTAAEQWFKIDLKEKKTFDTIEIDWDYNRLPESYELLISDDDVAYQKAAEAAGGPGGNQTVKFQPVQARYLKLVPKTEQNKAAAFFEIRIFHSGTAGAGKEEYTILINQKPLVTDVEPILVNDRLLVPFRAICEALGMEVSWNEELEQVIASKGDKTIVMTIGNNEIDVDSEVITCDVAPMLHNDRTMVPLRFLAENIGADVQWDGATNTVTITQ